MHGWRHVLLVAVAYPLGAQSALEIWATEEKVWREELRPREARGSTLWRPPDAGELSAGEVRLSAARNEVVSFGLVLEAREVPLTNVQVIFPGLPGLRARPPDIQLTDGSELWDWRHVEVEVFYLRYLEIRGIGKSFSYDERLLPPRMQRPWTPMYEGRGVGNGTWRDRPGANKHWPEIAVPIELHRRFNISANESQMIWVDIYVPKGACPGDRRGNLTVAHASGGSSASIDVSVTLKVRRFELPDEPAAKTMLPYEGGDVWRRFIGQNWVHCFEGHLHQHIPNRFFQLAWRHKVALVGGSFDMCVDAASPKRNQPSATDVEKLTGDLFKFDRNYTGPGQGVGTGLYVVGLYASWRAQWGTTDELAVTRYAKIWVDWFKNAPYPVNETDYFWYVIDESLDYNQTEVWASWMQGTGLRSMATLKLPSATQNVPSLDMSYSTLGFAWTPQWEEAYQNATKRGRPQVNMYNGGRPAHGGFSIEEESSAPRTIPWAMYKKKIHRYFYWMSTYYTNFQAGEGGVDIFNRAMTFGRIDNANDTLMGETGWMYGNGDGVLMYPGTDKAFPNSSYGVPGPIASLRLKHWRRGIQDVEYLELFRKTRGDAAVDEILNRMIPKVLWEVGCNDPNDQSWARVNTSWPEQWDAWEQVRQTLADAIEADMPAAAANVASCTPAPPPDPQEPPPEPCHPTGGALEFNVPDGGKLRVWATEEKVLREEHWAKCSANKTRSSLWNGSAIHLFGGRNEVVSFALVLEANTSSQGVAGISVSLPTIGGLRSRRTPTPAQLSDAIFDWRETEIELFFVRYLQIRGLSGNGVYYDERLWSRRMQRPWVPGPGGVGLGFGTFKDRPGAFKHWPEIAVPLELHPTFNITAGESQMIWVDVYLPKELPPGELQGNVTVSIGGKSWEVPVKLRVHNFTIPDKAKSRTMVPIEGGDIDRRFYGQNWVHCSKEYAEENRRLFERHWHVAWRHRVELVAGSFDSCLDYLNYTGQIVGDLQVFKDAPGWNMQRRLNGSTFTPQRNYSGPGMGRAVDLFPIGLYGKWSAQKWDFDPNGTQIGLRAGFQVHLNRWEEWFRQAGPPANGTERFLYLIDESHDYPKIQEWSEMIHAINGSGSKVATFATLSLLDAVNSTPALDIACTTMSFADTPAWEAAVNKSKQLDMKLWLYNGGHPAHGMTNTEGDATDWRTIPWALWKHDVPAYFYWMSTYYTNYQASEGAVNVFRRARTFGMNSTWSDVDGEDGWMYGNGDGVLFYPGTDKDFPEESYGVWGPFASLRMKYWRRGIQDVEYLELYKQLCGDPAAKAIAQRIVPKVLWEVGVKNSFPEISWPQDWDPWERLRRVLADAIEAGDCSPRSIDSWSSATSTASESPAQTSNTSASSGTQCRRVSTAVLAPLAAQGYRPVSCADR